jgi:transposase-like protein
MRPIYLSTCPNCQSKHVSLEDRRTVTCQDCGAEFNHFGYSQRQLADWGKLFLLFLLLVQAVYILFVVVLSCCT